jgi:hypothetical protein
MNAKWIAVMLVAGASLAVPLSAEGPGVITWRLVNGTAGGPEPSGADLRQAEPIIDGGGTRFQVWVGQSVGPGTRLTLDLRGLPSRFDWREQVQAAALPGFVFGAVALLVGGAFWSVRSRRRLRVIVASRPPSTTGDLIEALADLDDAFEAGQLAEPAYRRRPTTPKDRLRTDLGGGSGGRVFFEEAPRA